MQLRPGGPGLVAVYHLTNEEGYRGILESGWVQARSHPFWRVRLDKGELGQALEAAGADFGKQRRIARSDRCIVGFDEPVPRGWISLGLSKYLLSHLLTKSARLQQYAGRLFSFEMKVHPQRVFVREHGYLSEPYFVKYFGQMYRQDGRRFWQVFINNVLDSARPENRGIAECIAHYLKSTITLQEYLGRGLKYAAAEMWYEGDYKCEPFSGIKRLSGNAVEILQGKH